MAKLVSVQQAAFNAMASWLKSSLPRDWFIDTRWPDPDRVLPAKAVTILPAGPTEWTMVDPMMIGGPTPIGVPGKAQYTWLLRLGIQPVQLDVWCNNDSGRDDMMARLEPVLNAGEALTGVSGLADPFRNGVLLNLADGWTGTCDFVFNDPEWTDDPSSIGRSEYRVTMRGEAVFNLTATAVSVQIAEVHLKQKLSEFDVAPSNQLYDIFTTTPTGVTESQGP